MKVLKKLLSRIQLSTPDGLFKAMMIVLSGFAALDVIISGISIGKLVVYGLLTAIVLAFLCLFNDKN